MDEINQIIILGDLLYYGSIHHFKSDENITRISNLLNTYAHNIIAVRGNNDDKKNDNYFDFDIIDNYQTIEVDSKVWYLTHGHCNHTLPFLEDNTILLSGHSHMSELRDVYINPGSLSLPRGGTCRSYILYENNKFTLYDLEQEMIVDQIKLKEQ